MDLKSRLEEKFGRKNILDKCNEGCALKDVSRKNFIIISGDDVKNPKSDESSVDCIIIDLRKNDDGEYRVILCELTKSTKELDKAKSKFRDSGKLIIESMKEFDESIYKIDCLLLGNIVKNGKNISKKHLLKPLNIQGYNKKDAIIIQKYCGFSIKELY